MGKNSIAFAQFVLDLDRGELSRNGEVLQLRKQSFAVLCHLVSRRGCLVSKREIMDVVWGDVPVSDDSLTHCLIDIRKVLGDSDRTLVKTVPRRGYMLDAPGGKVSRGGLRFSSLLPVAATAMAILVAASLVWRALELPVNEQDRSLQSGAIRDVANDLYQQGMFLFQRRSNGDVIRARDYFLDAIGHRDQFAEAWAALAGTYLIEFRNGPVKDNELLLKLKASAERAVEIDPANAVGWLRLSGYYLAIGDAEAADRMFERARSSSPEEPLLLSMQAGKLLFAGEVENAIYLQERVVAQNPLSVVDRINLSYFLYAANRYADALDQNRRAYDLTPDVEALTDPLQGFALILTERYEESLVVVDTWPNGPAKASAKAMAHHMLGNIEIAVDAMKSLTLSADPESYIRRAELYAFCGKLEESIATLRELNDRFAPDVLSRLSDSGMLEEMFSSPFLLAVREDPRWPMILEEMRGSDLTVAFEPVPLHN